MSYARMGGDSDVYVYHHYMGWIECCGCHLTDPDPLEDLGFFKARTARQILEHLDIHVAAGDIVPEHCYSRILEDYPNVDAAIEEHKADRNG